MFFTMSFLINLTISSIITLLLILNMSNQYVSTKIKVLTFYLWITAFLPLYILPFDITNINYGCQYSTSLDTIWLFTYILNLINGQIIIPFCLFYVESGYIEHVKKLKNSIVSYTVYISAKIVLLILFVALVYLFIALVNYDLDLDRLYLQLFKALNTL